MPNDYNVAADVLKKAAASIRSNAQVHGDTERSFKMIGEMWQTYLDHNRELRGYSTVTPFDVAQMMVMVKMARAAYGFSLDNHVDQVGYAALGAMMNPEPVKKTNQVPEQLVESLKRELENGNE